MRGIVVRRDGDLRLRAGLVKVRVRLRRQIKTAVCGKRITRTGDFTVSFVGHAGFNSIAQIVVVLVQRRRQSNREFTVGVECSLVFLLLLPGVVVAAATFLVAFRVSRVGIFLIAFVAPRSPPRTGMHDPRHLGVRHRLAKKVARFNGRPYRLPLHHARTRGSHSNLVLGLLVLLNAKAHPAHLAFTGLGVNAPVAQRGIGGNRVVAVQRSIGVDRKLL